MSNYRRALAPGGVFFFTVVTHGRAPLFVSEEKVEMLRAALRKVKAVRPFEIDAIVVLPDHLHCIWRLPEGDGDFSGRWREIKKFASREIDARTNQRNERSVWQRRFWEQRFATRPTGAGTWITSTTTQSSMAWRRGRWIGLGRLSAQRWDEDGTTRCGVPASRRRFAGWSWNEVGVLVDALRLSTLRMNKKIIRKVDKRSASTLQQEKPWQTRENY